MEARIGNSPSAAWRSICWGRDLFSKGHRWRVGNGNMIQIDKDPWINRPGSRTSIIVNESVKGKRVNWLLDLIRQHFLPHDVEDILNIPIGIRSSRDKIIWHPDKKGIFKVKGAYHLAMDIKSKEKATQSDRSKTTKEWKSLWNSWILPRTKICTWKIVNDIIPCKANILKKGIDLNPLCFICKKKTKNHLPILYGNANYPSKFGNGFALNSWTFLLLVGLIGVLETIGVGWWII